MEKLYLETGSHELAGGQGAAIGGLELSVDLLVEVAAKAASLTGHKERGSHLDVGSLDLDEQVQGGNLQDDAIEDGIDDGLDDVVVADLEAAVLVQALVTELGSVHDDVASGVQLDGVVEVHHLDHLVGALLTSSDGQLGLLGAIREEDVLALIHGVVVEASVEGVDGLGSNEALVLGSSAGGHVGRLADPVGSSVHGEGGRPPGLDRVLAVQLADVVGNEGLSGEDEGPVAGLIVRIVLDVPVGAVRGVVTVGLLNGEGVQDVGDVLADGLEPAGERGGKFLLNLGGHLVVVVGLVQIAGLLASRAAVHEAFRHVLLALLSDRAVHGVLGGEVVAVSLGLDTDPVLVAVLAEADGLVSGHVEDVLAESVVRRLVPVAHGGVAEGVLVLLVCVHAGSNGGVLLDAEVGEVLGVPAVLGHAQGGVEVDESAVLLLGGQTGPQEAHLAALDVLEEALNGRLELGNDGLVGGDLGSGGLARLGLSGLEDDGVLAVLDGLLGLEPGVDGTGLGSFRLVAEDVLAVLQIQRDEAELGETGGVQLLEPLHPRSEIGEVQLALGDEVNVHAEAVAQRDVALLDGLLLLHGDDVVGLLVFQGGLEAVHNVAGDGVGLDMVVLEKKCKSFVRILNGWTRS